MKDFTEREVAILQTAVGHWLDEMKGAALFGVEIADEEITEIEKLYEKLSHLVPCDICIRGEPCDICGAPAGTPCAENCADAEGFQ